MIREVVDFVEAKRTLQSVQDYLLTAEAIIQNHPTCTLEEIKLVSQRMMLGQYGKFYERLKTGEFLDCLCKHGAKLRTDSGKAQRSPKPSEG